MVSAVSFLQHVLFHEIDLEGLETSTTAVLALYRQSTMARNFRVPVEEVCVK